MENRVLARSRALQRSGRVVVWALLAAFLLVSASPAGAWDTYWENPAPAPQQALHNAKFDNVPFTWVGFGEPDEFSKSVASEATEEFKASLTAPQSSTGDLIVSNALSFVGYPYAYGGASPGGFDCSGFTQYVVGITTGIWISHAVEGQPGSAGVWVEYGAWQPGDLIFFQNTYRAGISHAAIYIGDGLIVHAENESTGVTIDSIYSGYYGPRYWGSVRIG